MKVSVFKTNQTQSLNFHFLSDLGKVKFVLRLCRFPGFHLEEEAMMISREWFYGFAGVPSIRIFTVYVLKEGLMASKSSSSSQIHLLPKTFWASIAAKKTETLFYLDLPSSCLSPQKKTKSLKKKFSRGYSGPVINPG